MRPQVEKLHEADALLRALPLSDRLAVLVGVTIQEDGSDMNPVLSLITLCRVMARIGSIEQRARVAAHMREEAALVESACH
jgi:hypothetical protein